MKCKNCSGGSQRVDNIIAHEILCPSCKGTGIQPEIIPLNVPDGYEYIGTSEPNPPHRIQKIWDALGKEYCQSALFLKSNEDFKCIDLPYKIGDEYVCSECDDRGWGVKIEEDEKGIPRWVCPSCQGIERKVKSMEVEGNNLIIWLEEI